MKDSDLRGAVLQAFYEARKTGTIGVGYQNLSRLVVPGIEASEALRIAKQLGQYGLVDWNGVDGGNGVEIAGAGMITAFGVDVIEGERPAPLPVHIDQSNHVQHITISGQHGNVQVGGAHSQQHVSITETFEDLIRAVDEAAVSPEDKKEAKGKLGAFLSSSAAGAIFGPTVTTLLKHLGL